MKLLYSLLFILLPLLSWSTEPVKVEHTKKKELHKEFTVNPDAMVNLKNKFGAMSITTNDGNQVIIDVKVTVSGDDLDDVQDRLKEIDVQFDHTPSRLSARTIVEEENTGWTSWFSRKKKVSIQIDYIVSMPISCDLDARNDYGRLSLDQLNGHAQLKSDYGSMDIGSLQHENVFIELDYAKKSRFDFINSGTIKADYSTFIVGKSNDIELKADYSFCTFNKVENININAEFGDVSVGRANKLIGRGDYVTFKIDTVINELNLNTDYGSITVNELKTSFNEVIIRSDFTGVNVNYESGSVFNFDIDTEYAGINVSKDLVISRSEKDYTDKRISGYSIDSNSNNSINIRTSYGGVKLKSN